MSGREAPTWPRRRCAHGVRFTEHCQACSDQVAPLIDAAVARVERDEHVTSPTDERTRP